MQALPSYHPSDGAPSAKPSRTHPPPPPAPPPPRHPPNQARSVQLISEIVGDHHEQGRASLWRLAQLQRKPRGRVGVGLGLELGIGLGLGAAAA